MSTAGKAVLPLVVLICFPACAPRASNGPPASVAKATNATNSTQATAGQPTSQPRAEPPRGILVRKAAVPGVRQGAKEIHTSAYQGNAAAIADLLKKQPGAIAAVDPDGLTPLHYAAQSGAADVVALLLASGAEVDAVNKAKQTPLHMACQFQPQAEVIDMLLALGADPATADEYGDTPLHMAARAGDGWESIVALLATDAAADSRDQEGRTPLQLAVEANQPAVAALLLPKTEDIDVRTPDGASLLFWALGHGRNDMVAVLLDRGAPTDRANADGETPLHEAAFSGQSAAVRSLLAAGADVEAVDESEWTPLHGAAWNGHAAVARLLLAAGADADGASEQYTPLHAAAWQGHEQLAGMLVRHGADPDAADGDGQTALHKAAWQGHAGVVRMLVAAGARAGIKDTAGFTAMDKARSRLGESKQVGVAAADKRSYGPEQATGPPDTNQAGDLPTAWASQSSDGQDEWLLLDYANEIDARQILVHENCSPGAVNKATAFLADGSEVEVWSGTDPTPRSAASGVSQLNLSRAAKTRSIKLHIASSRVPGWNEIDAVGLIDAAGQTHWAVRAQASTTYATGPDPLPPYEAIIQQLAVAKQ